MVLYAPDKESASVMSHAQPGIADDPGLRILPATVLKHEGQGRVRLVVAGLSGVFTAPHGERAPGEPETGCWTWPQISRAPEMIQVPVRARS